MTQARKVFPIGLLLEDKACLVVGGGKVATHKANLLCDSGAIVTVVAPALSQHLSDLSRHGRITLHERCFAPEDLAKQEVVYAATDDPALNCEILRLCRQRRILCCAVDAGWRHGDFLTPAVVRKGDLTVSVSTAGRACRRSRLVKESLARHIDSISSAGLSVIGTSHEQLALIQREPLHLVGPRFLATGRMLSQVWGLHEYSLLNTCNRVELHMIGLLDEDRLQLLKRVLGFDQLSDEQYYIKQGLEAFEHTCALCAGLLSQMPGENHIVAQLKQALEASVKAGWAAGMMREWMSAVLHVSKEVRQATASFLHGREIEDLAADYLATRIGATSALQLLVLGTGKTGAGFVKRIADVSPRVKIDWCYHRNRPEPPETRAGQVRLCDMNNMRELLARADVVVSAVTSEQCIITADAVPFLGRGRATLFLDLAMPRNIDASIAALVPDVTIVDLDTLKHWYRKEQIDMLRLRRICSDLVCAHQDYYDKLIASFQGRNKEQ